MIEPAIESDSESITDGVEKSILFFIYVFVLLKYKDVKWVSLWGISSCKGWPRALLISDNLDYIIMIVYNQVIVFRLFYDNRV